MKTKLILLTENKKLVCWTELPFNHRINELLNVQDILKKEEIDEIKQSAKQWSGITGIIKSIEYRHDDNDYFTEVRIWCENQL
jgi:hypothetical protein